MNTSNDRPNIILIVADDLGYGDLSCYGSTLNRSPNIDSLAHDGVRFTDFCMAASVCSPSRAALMTGCYPKRVGLEQGDRASVLRPADSLGLSTDEVSLAQALRDRGYATALVGKWHLGDQPPFMPTRHGFDSYFGLPYSNDMGPGHWQEEFPPIPLIQGACLTEVGPHQSTLTHRYTDECIRFIAANSNRPFFLYFAHMYVHLPLFVPPEFLERSQNGAYGAAVECMDYSTGRILAALDRLGIAEETLVIFTSDNGSNGKDGGSNAPLRGTKGTTWEGGFRVPCVMRWPEHLRPGRVCAEPLTAMDLMPTLCRVSGAAEPTDRIIDGDDMSTAFFGTGPAADGTSPAPDRPFCYYKGPRLEAVRAGRFKLKLAERELYDLTADQSESTNVAPAHPEVVLALDAVADRYRTELGDRDLAGTGCRPPGFVEHPELIHDRPEFICTAEYDMEDSR